jgi:hypothetical protein
MLQQIFVLGSPFKFLHLLVGVCELNFTFVISAGGCGSGTRRRLTFPGPGLDWTGLDGRHQSCASNNQRHNGASSNTERAINQALLTNHKIRFRFVRGTLGGQAAAGAGSGCGVATATTQHGATTTNPFRFFSGTDLRGPGLLSPLPLLSKLALAVNV